MATNVTDKLLGLSPRQPKTDIETVAAEPTMNANRETES